MAEIRIKVGVSIDQSMKTAFKPLVLAAQEARKQILREFSQVPREIAQAFAGLGKAQGAAMRSGTTEAQRAHREQVKEAREAAREMSAIARGYERELLNEHKQAQREKASLDRAASSLARQQSAAMYREYVQNERSARRELESFARRTSHRATRFLAPELPLMSIAGRALSGVLHGYGVDTSFSGAMERNVDLESTAVRVSNKARLAGQDVSAGAVENRVREVSDKYGLKRSQATEALEAFVDKSGDLKMGLAVLDKIAERSIIMSSDMKDLASTMGATSNQLGNTKDKTQRLFDTLDSFGVQADRGFTSMSQLAKQSPRLVPLAQMFGGDRETNFARLGTMVQLALIGGAGTTPQAATAVRSFATVFNTKARLEQARKLGILGEHEKVGEVDPLELIRRSIIKTNGDQEKLFGSVFKNVNSQSVVRKALNDYNAAGGGAKGEAAIDALFGRFMDKRTISPQDEAQALEAKNNTTAARVQRFQNALDDVTKNVQSALLPVLEKAEPMVLKLAQAFGEATKWALENPGKAITYAIIASIARAGIESALRSGIENLIFRAARGMGAPGTGTAGGGLSTGGIGRAAGVVMTGLAIGLPVYEAIKNAGESTVDANMQNIDASARETAWFRKRAEDPHGTSPADREKAHRNLLDREEELKEAKRSRYSGWQGFLDSGIHIPGIKGGTFNMFGRDENIRQIEADLKVKRRAMQTMDATKYIPADETSRWQAKPGTTDAEFHAALKSGDRTHLEKIAVQIGKQETLQQQQLAEQKSGNQLLQQIADKVGGGGGSGNGPTVPPANGSPDFEP